jgi:membrane protease YdiL (CAAX protease family)
MDARSPGPWGPWLTLGLSAAIMATYSMAQGLALVPMIAVYAAGGASPPQSMQLAMSGFNLALALCATCPLLVLLCGVAAWARRGPTLEEYLAIRPVKKRWVAAWTLLMIVAALGLSALNEALDRPVPEFIVMAYETSGHFAVFWIAIALCAPFGEEVLFRGFIFAGLERSRLGAAGTIIVTSILFTGLHIGQYGWVDLAQVGLVGALLGLARWRTGSLIPPLAMHIALNLTSLALYEWTERNAL